MQIGEMSQKLIMYDLDFQAMILNNSTCILILGQYMFDAHFLSYSLCFAFFSGERKPGFHS